MVEEEYQGTRQWSRNAQAVASVIWISFLTAAVATMVFFAIFDPAELAGILDAELEIGREAGYAAGCFFFCRHDDYRSCGGFSEQVYASEEIWLSRCLKRRGKKSGRRFCVIASPGAMSSGRKLHWYGHGAQIILLLALLLFPFLVRYRRFCGFWYRRPPDRNDSTKNG